MTARQRLRTYAGRKSIKNYFRRQEKKKKSIFIDNFVLLQTDTLLESESVKDGRVNRQL